MIRPGGLCTGNGLGSFALPTGSKHSQKAATKKTLHLHRPPSWTCGVNAIDSGYRTFRACGLDGGISSLE